MQLQASPTLTNPPPFRRQFRKEDPLDDSPLPNCPIREIVLTEHDKQLAGLRGGSAMAIPRSMGSRYAAAWAESLASGH